MAKDLLPAVNSGAGSFNVNTDEDITILYHNVSPIKTGKDEYSLGVRPALGTVTTTASIDDNSRGRGIAEFLGYDLFIVNDDTVYYSGGSTEIHSTQAFDKELLAKFTLYSQAGSPRLVLVNAGATSIAGTSDGSVWFFTSITGAPTQITDVDMPGNNGQSLIRGGVSLDGFFFVADIDGKIHNCDVDVLTAWNPLSFITAEREPDVGVYLAKHRDHVMYLGTRSIEFFYNAANATGSPLTRRADIYYTTGCFHPNAVLELGDTTYFVGKDAAGLAAIFAINNFGLDVLPVNSVVDDVLKGLEYADPTISAATNFQQDVYLASFNSAQNGQFLVLTTPSGSFAFHFETSTWAKWYVGTTPANNGGIADWTSPKIFPLTGSLNRAGANTTEPNRYLLLNGEVASENALFGVNVGQVADYTYNSKNLDTSNEVTTGRNVHITENGLKFYALSSDAVIFQYTLTTAYDISTAAYDSKSLDIDSIITTGADDAFWVKPDGTSLYYSTTEQVYELDFGTAYDITTLTFTAGNVINLKTLYGGNPHLNSTLGGMVIRNDGLVLIGVSGTGSSTVFQFAFGTAWQINTLVSSNKTFDSKSNGNGGGDPKGIGTNAAGTTLYMFGDSDEGKLLQWNMSAWDISTIVETGSPNSSLVINATPVAFINGVGFTMSPTTLTIYAQDSAPIVYQYGDPNSTEFSGGLTSATNPDYIAYTKPWDKDTNERKKIPSIRVLHYADTRDTVAPSNLELDWIDLDKVSTTGITPAAFTGGRDINLASYTARIYRCGMTRQRIFKMVFDGTKSQIVKGLEIDFIPQRG